MSKHWLQLATVLVAVAGTSWALGTPTGHAAGYRITATKSLNRTPYHVKNLKKTLYSWDKTHTKKLDILNGEADSSWFVDRQVTMTHAGKSAIYLHLADEYNADDGYVYAKSMVKGYSATYESDEPDYGYYRLNADTQVPLRTKGTSSVKIPKGTVVHAYLWVSRGKEFLGIDGDALSYSLKQRIGLNSASLNSVNLQSVKATKIPVPAYSTVTDLKNGDYVGTNLLPGTGSAASTQTALLRTTSDGYVEYYTAGQQPAQSSRDQPVGKPESRKILKTTTSGQTTTIFYRQHIAGVKDTATTVAGASGYQLTIQREKSLKPAKNGAYQQFKLGGQAFFAPVSNSDQSYLESTTQTMVATQTPKRISEKVFAKAVTTLTPRYYYQTTKQLTLKPAFTVYSGHGAPTVKVTVPRGTLVAATKETINLNGKMRKVASIDTAALSQKILAPGYRQGFWISDTETVSTQPGAFKRVKKPAYLPKNGSAGDFYLGGTTALAQTQKLAKQSFRVTSDGYVERHQVDPQGLPVEYGGRPTDSIKIQRTTVKGHTRYLYLTQAIKGLKTTKVTYHGKKQYRLALINQQKTYVINQSSEEWPDVPYYYGIMTLGGKSAYTPYAEVAGANDH